ncbi:Phosphate transport system permease protein PstC (TC 3.A.1.7.1) [Patulibacter medicamentivorans]|uniref:Phosphate transport system permease protein PstC (TC 3.A.1.7.1) n=1 Tax=Patulibacter medicamentivorans TaxID=1097667 RepID=H0E648_9ACTN|nr:phosphate ABC transporter permease subunit PstC [Patulibacter medicamentivorans]EHN10817.1 Phosphate transport system permease protein PstC (TC 3.A.1.7.1) [Patulibacter medicamentivorans]
MESSTATVPNPDAASRLRETLARTKTGSWLDPWVKNALTGLAGLIFVLLAYFLIKLGIESEPVFSKYGFIDFITKVDWLPSKDTYGAGALVAGTLITSAIALLIGVPIAVATALFVTELAPARWRGLISGTLELLAAVPSVVYGLWGFLFLAPKLKGVEQWFADTFSFIPFIGGDVSAANYFITGLILAIMIIPIVSAISREVMATVPTDHKEAALALGATRWEMIRTAVLPYSRAGIVGGSMLGLGRALGETIAVAILIGGATAGVGDSIFSQGSTLASVIALEFQEATSSPEHRAALIGAGLLLFAVTLVINAIARGYITRAESRLKRAERDAKKAVAAAERGEAPKSGSRLSLPSIPRPELVTTLRGRKRVDSIARGWVAGLTGLALLPLALLLGFLVIKGGGSISWSFLTSDPTGAAGAVANTNRFLGDAAVTAQANDLGGIRSAILGTLEVVGIAAAVVVPIGIAVAVYLVEYGEGTWFGNFVRYLVDVMTGVPSVVFGLFVYITLVVSQVGGAPFAGWKASVALGLLMLPIVINSALPVLRLVPQQLREAALALGVPRWKVILRIVLPTAAPGLVTGSLLAIARAAGETAPIIFTAGVATALAGDPNGPLNTLPAQIYADVTASSSAQHDRAWGAALTLVVLILLLSLIARLAQRRSRIS